MTFVYEQLSRSGDLLRNKDVSGGLRLVCPEDIQKSQLPKLTLEGWYSNACNDRLQSV